MNPPPPEAPTAPIPPIRPHPPIAPRPRPRPSAAPRPGTVAVLLFVVIALGLGGWAACTRTTHAPTVTDVGVTGCAGPDCSRTVQPPAEGHWETSCQPVSGAPADVCTPTPTAGPPIEAAATAPIRPAAARPIPPAATVTRTRAPAYTAPSGDSSLDVDTDAGDRPRGLRCADTSRRNFPALPGDPRDADHDGIACEDGTLGGGPEEDPAPEQQDEPEQRDEPAPTEEDEPEQQDEPAPQEEPAPADEPDDDNNDS